MAMRFAAKGTASTVASSASSVTILAAQTGSARVGATVYNDSAAVLYLLLDSGTASTSNYTVQMQPAAYFETPFGYQGQITGIWASANGNARVMELT